MVRLEALRGFAARRDDGRVRPFVAATRDAEPHVALLALDQLAVCGGSRRRRSQLLESRRQRSLERWLGARLASRGARHRRARGRGAGPRGAAAWAVRRLDASGSCACMRRARPRTLEDRGRLERARRRRRRQRASRRRSKGCRRWPGTTQTRCTSQALGAPRLSGVRAAALALDATPKRRARRCRRCGRRWTRLSDEKRAELARHAGGDRRDADAARRCAAGRKVGQVVAATADSVLSTEELRRLARRARASRSRRRRPSIWRCSRLKRRRRCSASPRSPNRATTTA